MFVFAGSVSFLLASTTYTEPSLNVTFNVPGYSPFAVVVLASGFVVSSTVASARAASIVAFFVLSVVFAATPFFQKLLFAVASVSFSRSPTHAAKSTPFSPPFFLTTSAVFSFEAVAVNTNAPLSFSALSIGVFFAGDQVTGSL